MQKDDVRSFSAVIKSFYDCKSKLILASGAYLGEHSAMPLPLPILTLPFSEKEQN